MVLAIMFAFCTIWFTCRMDGWMDVCWMCFMRSGHGRVGRLAGWLVGRVGVCCLNLPDGGAVHG